MAQIKLSKETQQRLVSSIKRYFAENMDEEIGELKASLLLDYFLEEIGPCVYNRAIADARTYVEDKLSDIDGSLFAPEFEYWRKRQKERRD